MRAREVGAAQRREVGRIGDRDMVLVQPGDQGKAFSEADLIGDVDRAVALRAHGSLQAPDLHGDDEDEQVEHPAIPAVTASHDGMPW
jgi:hypothetical protein